MRDCDRACERLRACVAGAEVLSDPSDWTMTCGIKHSLVLPRPLCLSGQVTMLLTGFKRVVVTTPTPPQPEVLMVCDIVYVWSLAVIMYFYT